MAAPHPGIHCRYATTQIKVKNAYGLSVTAPERDALAAALTTCPSEPTWPAPTATPAPAPEAVVPQPTTGPSTPGTRVLLDMPPVGRIEVTVDPDGVPALTASSS